MAGLGGCCCGGFGLLLAPVLHWKLGIWSWVFSSKLLFLNILCASEVMLWWPSSRGVKLGGGCTLPSPISLSTPVLGDWAQGKCLYSLLDTAGFGKGCTWVSRSH